MTLPGAEQAAANIQKLLADFRKKKLPVIHVQHISVREGATFFLPDTAGAEIHHAVQPAADEKVIVKHWPNSFRDTELQAYLAAHNIRDLAVCGMMTSMCVDATVRAAKDLGVACTLLHDCTAAPAAEFAGVSCSADQVRAAFTWALAYLCDRVVSAGEMAAMLDDARQELSV
jgi:nicotinamidase-related amidase